MAETRRVRMTKRMIREALLELLERGGSYKPTVTDICEAADVNRSTFYAYYQDTAELMHEIEDNVLEQIPVSPYIPTAQTSERFLDMLTEFFEYVRMNERLFRILIMRFDSGDFNRRLVETVLEKYHQNAIIENTLLARYGYVYSINGVIGLLKEWIGQGFPIDSRMFSKIILQMSMQANAISEDLLAR